MKQIVLFSGKAESGKDYMAIKTKETLETHDRKVLIFHYADYLKHICKKHFGWDGNKDDVGREILQRIGTDIIRARTPEFWVRNACQFIKAFWNEYDYVLIADCRFPNEIEFITNKFGEELISSIKIERFNEQGFPFENSLTYEQNSHLSEIALNTRLDLFDLVVKNNGFNYRGFNVTNGEDAIILHLKLKLEGEL